MIPQLKEGIDNLLNPVLKDTNKWQIYEECKLIIRSWENIYNKRLSSNEYKEYIIYITDRLNL